MKKRKTKKTKKMGKRQVQKVQIIRPPKLDEEDALFLAYYFLYEFKGSYPFITMCNGQLTELPGELFKHLIRNILGIQGGHIERQIIHYLRTITKSQIKNKTYNNFPILKKRKDLDERIIFMYNKLESIKNDWKKLETILPTETMETKKMENVEKNDAVEENVVAPIQMDATTTETPKYKSIEDFTAQTGKRFRRKKAEKQSGLSREEAFAQRFMNE